MDHSNHTSNPSSLRTEILPVHNIQPPLSEDPLEWFRREGSSLRNSQHLLRAAEALRISQYPVAFPTETVYGLGADATRSESVQGIYSAKQRPADNPLIVHFSTLHQLENFVRPIAGQQSSGVPSVYKPLISRFWPGPLTVLLPVPSNLSLAKPVTHGLRTFGARIPFSALARLLIGLADRPIAAPSANASGKPSPTTAEHVFHDLNGKIELILDGGPCGVGVESTVVDGLSEPPAILRPGGIGIDEIRSCGGVWSDVTTGYHDKKSELAAVDNFAPRAPGMKYRHYAPKAKVVLLESNLTQEEACKVLEKACVERHGQAFEFGVIRTRNWDKFCCLANVDVEEQLSSVTSSPNEPQVVDLLLSSRQARFGSGKVTDVQIGHSAQEIARNLFSALRVFDQRGIELIIIEGIPDTDGDLAAAVMNRLRKAAEIDVRQSS